MSGYVWPCDANVAAKSDMTPEHADSTRTVFEISQHHSRRMGQVKCTRRRVIHILQPDTSHNLLKDKANISVSEISRGQKCIFACCFYGARCSTRFEDLCAMARNTADESHISRQALDLYPQDNCNNTSAGGHFSSDHEKDATHLAFVEYVIPDSDC